MKICVCKSYKHTKRKDVICPECLRRPYKEMWLFH